MQSDDNANQHIHPINKYGLRTNRLPSLCWELGQGWTGWVWPWPHEPYYLGEYVTDLVGKVKKLYQSLESSLRTRVIGKGLWIASRIWVWSSTKSGKMPLGDLIPKHSDQYKCLTSSHQFHTGGRRQPMTHDYTSKICIPLRIKLNSILSLVFLFHLLKELRQKITSNLKTFPAKLPIALC